MKKRRLGSFFVLVIVLCVIFFGRYGYGQKAEVPGTASGAFEIIRSVARSLLSGEPEEVAALREAEVAQTDEGHQEYYFRQLGDEERRVYREMLNGVRERKENFYHGMLLGLLRYKENWLVMSNAETGEVYPDILIEVPQTRTGIVIEVKYAEDGKFAKACSEAIDQIEEKRYTARLEDDGMNTIFKYGIAFYRKRCKVVRCSEV